MPSQIDVKENRRALIETIRECDLELMDLKASKKDVEEELAEHVAGFEESKEVKRLTLELENAKKKQAAVLSQDGDFATLMDQKAGINQKIADAKEVLSTHVVAWKTLTGEDQVEYDEVMGKQVIVTGRLGKMERYQTSLLTPPETRAKMADPLEGFQKMADKHDVSISIGNGKDEVVVAAPKKRGRPPKKAA